MVGRSFEKLVVFGGREYNIMASGGRLLGLQLPPVPSHLSDFMPACVRSAHNGDAKDCCSNGAEPSASGLMAFDPLCSNLGGSGDINSDIGSLEQAQAMESQSSFALTYSEQDVEAGKEKTGAERSPSTDGSPHGVESRPTTSAKEDVSGTVGKQAGENSNHSQGRGLRSKLSSMLSLEKRPSLGGLPLVAGHSSQFMMEMSGFQSTSFSRRAPMADSKTCAAIQKDAFARMFDLYDERNIIASGPGYGVSGGYVGRSADAPEMGVRADLSWMDDRCNDAWGTEPWHSDQRNILMKTLHIMRCDIESLKVT